MDQNAQCCYEAAGRNDSVEIESRLGRTSPKCVGEIIGCSIRTGSHSRRRGKFKVGRTGLRNDS